MTLPTYIYVRIYHNYRDNTYWIYTGTTNNMKRKQIEHDKGLCQTTNRYQKHGLELKEIRYRELEDKELDRYERSFKGYHKIKKLQLSKLWRRWAV